MTRVELTSPTIGVVKRLGAAEGVVLKVGEVVCDIETEGESEEVSENPKEPDAEKPEPTSKPEPTPVKEEDTKEDESLHQSRDDILDNSGGAQFSGEAAMLPSPPPAPTHSHHVPREERREKQPWSELRKIVKASPAVRTLAARMGIELVDVKGSGEGGRVLRDDLTSHSASASHFEGSESRNEVEMGARDRGEIPEVTRVEFGRTRKVMYRAMGDMGQVPHFG
jgi:2-oxoisovalerate dehydrogenase E2 component (dihydrolipoyl transacylase)